MYLFLIINNETSLKPVYNKCLKYFKNKVVVVYSNNRVVREKDLAKKELIRNTKERDNPDYTNKMCRSS